MNNTNSIQSTENVVSLNQKISNNKINKSKEKKSKKIDKSIDSLESSKTI